MPLDNITNQIITTVDNIKGLDIETALQNQGLSPWNGLNQDDFRASYYDFITTMETAIEQDALKDFPHNILTSLNKNLSNVYQQLNNFANNKDQNHFQNSLSQLESNRTNIRTWGIKSYVDYGKEIEDKVKGFNAQYQQLIEKNKEINRLKESVQNLIEPAVAGSLSEAFRNRQKTLLTNQRVWLILTIISGIAAIWGTIYVIDRLVELFNPPIPENISVDRLENYIKREVPQTTIILLRLGILIPLYTLFAYFFRHYNKERNLEEEYAHRAAVASSLPNYGNLAGAEDVKDQIISSASKVVFSSPIDKKSNEIQETNSISDFTSLLDKVKDIIKIKE